jgi:hypothetical protein
MDKHAEPRLAPPRQPGVALGGGFSLEHGGGHAKSERDYSRQCFVDFHNFAGTRTKIVFTMTSVDWFMLLKLADREQENLAILFVEES